jgi:hypothetical protein
MTHEIDSHDGSVHLSSGQLLARDIGAQQVRAMGVSINDVFDMHTGWQFITSGPHTIFGKEAYLALAFFNDQLKRVHFSLKEPGLPDDPANVKRLHDSALANEFGVPQVQDSIKTMYIFTWGTIVSAYDPRGGQSEIVLTWQ